MYGLRKFVPLVTFFSADTVAVLGKYKTLEIDDDTGAEDKLAKLLNISP